MLHVHRAERADALAEALGELLGEPLPDPLTAEIVCVHTRGMERWLCQRLSSQLGSAEGHGDGVCANVQFPFPSTLIEQTVAAACGIAAEDDHWGAARTIWPLLDVLGESIGEPWLADLARHVGTESVPSGRRLDTVRQLAGLFERYALLRPQMLRAWAGDADFDTTRASAPGAWQAELWRRMRQRIAQPDPTERLELACAGLRDRPELVELAPRISLFCLTRLPAAHVQVLSALAIAREVHLFLLHPSADLWEALRAGGVGQPAIVRRAQDVTGKLATNQLLASWGRDAREMQLLLADVEGETEHRRVADPPQTLLGHIQRDVHSNRSAPGAPLPGQDDARVALEPEDHSLRIHACHGRARQVEVVREAILHLLESDATLEPREIIVMCPDIEAFAPLIQASFGAGEVLDEDELGRVPAGPHPPELKVRLADRSLRQTNPLLRVLVRLLELVEQRITASQLLDLAEQEPVGRRFRFDEDDLSQLRAWIAASAIRWGLDGPHRAPFKLDAVSTGTWRAGIDRILLGATMSEEDQRLFAGVLPLDDVESRAIDLAGRLAELLDRLQVALDLLNEPKTIESWRGAILAAADALTATSEREAWQRAELDRMLEQIVGEATSAGVVSQSSISLPELRGLLGDRLRGRPTRANFRTGHLSFCTLFPMRSVPHRVVCLLGLDDGLFPRKAPRDGDDLLLEDPHVGDRDARSEDRQILLDALLAATERLIITYAGNDERTNTALPPAVPVGELLDVIDATARSSTGPARNSVVLHHPLQPFDPRNFVAGELGQQSAWSFDPVALDGARALGGQRREIEPFLSAALPAAPRVLVQGEDLVRFVERPVRAFLRERMRIVLSERSEEIEDALAVELDPLAAWGVGQRMLQARLGGSDMHSAIAAEVARGSLPPGELAAELIQRVSEGVQAITAQTEALLHEHSSQTVDVRLELDGRAISATVANVRGEVLLATTYARVNPRHRLAAWVRLLLLTAADPARPWSAEVVGRARFDASGAAVTVSRLAPLAAEQSVRLGLAREHLRRLLDIYDRGMCEPLPLACQSAAAYAQAVAEGRDPVPAARKAWQSTFAFPGEDQEPEHVRTFGGVLSIGELVSLAPRADEQGDDWPQDDASRFGRYAQRLWGALLAHEELIDA